MYTIPNFPPNSIIKTIKRNNGKYSLATFEYLNVLVCSLELNPVEDIWYIVTRSLYVGSIQVLFKVELQ